MKFDTLIESFLTEGTISNKQRYGNISFDIEKLKDNLTDTESHDYKTFVEPFIEAWTGKGYLDRLGRLDFEDIFKHLTTLMQDEAEFGDEISHTRMGDIVNNAISEHEITAKDNEGRPIEPIRKRQLGDTTIGRLVPKFMALFYKMKDTHIETKGTEQDDEDMGSLEGMESGMNKPTSAAEEALLKFIQGSDGVSREEAVNFLSTKSGMGRESEDSNNIINILISKKEIIETEDGNLEINTESGMVDSLASDSDYAADDEIETGIPFRGRGIEDEDEDVADTFRRTTEGDGDFQRSGW